MKRVYQTQLYVLIVLFVFWNQGLRRQITMIYIVRTLLCTAPVFFRPVVDSAAERTTQASHAS